MPKVVYTIRDVSNLLSLDQAQKYQLTLNRKQGKDARKPISRQTIRTRRTRNDIPRKRICRILHRAHKDAQVAPSKRNNRRRRARPRNILSRRPRKPEQSQRQPKAAQHGRVQPVLGRDPVRRKLGDLLPVEQDLAGHDGGEADDAANDNRNKHQAGLLRREVIDGAKSIRNAAEEAKQRPKVDGDVEADERDDWFGEEHLDRADGGDDGKGLDALAHGRQGRQLDAALLGQAALEDGVECLADGAPEADAEGGEEEHCPFRPAPALFNRDEGADDGAGRSI